MGTRKKRRRQRRAFRQGDLDGLCGVYSVVNAVRAIVPELGKDGAAWLFAELIQALREAGANPSRAVSCGIGRSTLMALLLRLDTLISQLDDEASNKAAE